MKISRKQFYLITLCFLLLPFSMNWKLLVFGEKTTGVVTEHKHIESNGLEIDCPVIQYETDKETISFLGPSDNLYPVGEHFTIFYNKKKPEKFLLFNISGLLFRPKMIIPGVLFILWLAFYFSFKQNTVKKKKTDGDYMYSGRKSLSE